LVSRSGAIEVPVIATEDISRGVVAVPHGWGHRGGGWRQANHDGGANVNELASINPEDLEQLAGMSHLSGIRIRAERVELAI
jgi:anaerobic selenocysteine-containing dehydrogenase